MTLTSDSEIFNALEVPDRPRTKAQIDATSNRNADASHDDGRTSPTSCTVRDRAGPQERPDVQDRSIHPTGDRYNSMAIATIASTATHIAMVASSSCSFVLARMARLDHRFCTVG